MILLIFFALPLATILLAIVLEKVLHCPILVGITFFAVYLIILFTLFATGVITNLGAGLVAIIIYTILALITAYIVKLIRIIHERCFNNDDRCPRCRCCRDNDENHNCDNNDLLRISYRCNNGNSQDLLTINSNCSNSGNDDNDNGNCNRGDNNDNTVSANNRDFINRECNTKPI